MCPMHNVLFFLVWALMVICSECHARMRRGAERNVQLHWPGMRTRLWMSGTHGEHNTPPKRLSTRAMNEAWQKFLSCALRLTRIQTTQIPRIESQLKLPRTQHVRNNVHSTSFAQPRSRNQLSLPRSHITSWLKAPYRYHCCTTSSSRSRGINQGPTQFSLSTVCFDNSPGTTIPQAHRNVCSLAIGNTFVTKSALFPFPPMQSSRTRGGASSVSQTPWGRW